MGLLEDVKNAKEAFVNEKLAKEEAQKRSEEILQEKLRSKAKKDAKAAFTSYSLQAVEAARKGEKELYLGKAMLKTQQSYFLEELARLFVEENFKINHNYSRCNHECICECVIYEWYNIIL